MIRTICGVAGTAALAVAGLAPAASATGSHHDHHGNDEVNVLVCVKADEDHHGDDHNDGDYGHHHDDGDYHGDHGDHGDHGSKYVTVRVKTDEERSSRTKIYKGDCERFELDYDKSWVRVKAWPENSDDDLALWAFGHDKVSSRTSDNKIKVYFDEDADHPFVGVGIKVEDHYYGHDHHYDD